LVEVWLPYGKTEVCVRVPAQNLMNIVEPNEKDAAQNPQSELESSLVNPLGTKPLREMVKSESKVALVLRNSDTSTNQITVSALLNELNSAGVRNDNVTVIVAYDPLCDYQTRHQMPVLGEGLSSRVRVVHHDPENLEQINIGRTSRGTDVFLNKAFVEADVKIAAGVVEPHPFAGYSGGGELISPGVSSLETIHSIFLLALEKNAERGIVEDNPVHDDVVEATRLAKVDFCLNVVRNGGLEVVNAFAGDVEDSFTKAVKLADEIYKIPIESRAEAVFMSPGGFPFDGSLFESCRCLDVAVNLSKRGRSVVLVAECANGLGNREFVEAVSRYDSPKVLEKELKRNFTVSKLVAYHLLAAVQDVKVSVVSVVPDYLVAKVHGIKGARTANEAYRYVSDIVGKNGKVSFVPYGNLTISCTKTAE
jgi:nickel-dependent lactate racemase